MKRRWKDISEKTEVSGDITHALAEVLEAADRAINKIKGCSFVESEKPDISTELLIMLNVSDEILELAKPSLQVPELYGIPKSALLPYQSLLTARHTDHEDWDFIPWLLEKIQNVKFGTKYAIDWWECTPCDIREDVNDKVGFLKESMLESIGMAKHNAKVIFDQLCNFKLELEAIK